MASRNGLSPKIRGPRGVGFNRALPAPFGFDNGFTGDGNDDYFTIPKLVGVNLPLQFSIEFWIKTNAAWLDNFDAAGGYFSIQDTALKTFYLAAGTSTHKGFVLGAPVGGNGNPPDYLVLNAKNHVAVTYDFINGVCSEIYNGNVALKITSSLGAYVQQPIREVNVYRNLLQYCGTMGIDEFRLYNRIISDVETFTNYNGGVGFNASITDGLLAWYKFEKFESLDFSALQDGSDMRTGIRDMSGKNNHALPQGAMITNPVNPGYVLKPF